MCQGSSRGDKLNTTTNNNNNDINNNIDNNIDDNNDTIKYNVHNINARIICVDQGQIIPPTTTYSLVTKQAATGGLLTEWVIPTLFSNRKQLVAVHVWSWFSGS